MLRSTLKKTAAFALVAVVAFAMATPARAVLVTYSTYGSWTATPTGTTVAADTINGVTITFNGVTNNDLVGAGSPSFDSFGTFTVTGGSSTPKSVAGLTFTLYIVQTSPTAVAPGYVAFTSTTAGTIATNNSSANVQFAAPLTETLVVPGPVGGSVTYDILNNGLVHLSPPGAGGAAGNPQNIAGEVLASVPEPTTIVSALSGLVIFACVARFRRRRAS